ncbi:hypothetical protein FQR65_LT01145 [Abscondita terminalis]|nr:hypothetical protein FQR65_LT01145 [Abscondita terminalis]
MLNLMIFVIMGFHVEARQPLVGLDVKQLIAKEGYPVETHKMITEDQYVLRTIRIPYGKNNQINTKRPAVLLFSGLICCAADWVNMEQKSLGFILAENGYDVWLGNARGSTLSKKHLRYNPIKHAKEFWNYGIHEVAYYDLPANIDYIKNVTGQDKIFYIGYSHGTTAWFALMASRPEYNKAIRCMAALAPAMLFGNSKNIIIDFLHTYMKELEELVQLYDLYEILPHNSIVPATAELLCHENSMFREICAALFFFIAGYSPDYLNRTRIPVIVSNTPSGCSFLQIKHYVQLYYTEHFQQYDYDKKENLRIYGTETPRKYDVSKITAPVTAYYGSADILVSYIDAERTISALPNVVFAKKIARYNHFDVMWGSDVENKVFASIVKQFGKY